MAIGLTSEQLFKIFIDSFATKQTQLHTDIITTEIGPEMNKMISELREKYTNVLTIDQFNTIIAIVLAFMDSVVSNNNELAKILLHTHKDWCYVNNYREIFLFYFSHQLGEPQNRTSTVLRLSAV
jgi:hypothetical protein